jgi:hypothetical protein
MIPNLVVNAYRAGLCLLISLALAGCAAPFRVPTASARHPIITDGYFTLASGQSLPYRDWLPKQPPRAVVLALHGFNDSRDAWAMPAPHLAAAGIAVFAPDQRGFGAAPGRRPLAREGRRGGGGVLTNKPSRHDERVYEAGG